MTFEEKLEKLMTQNGINGKKLARKSGISRSSICLYLKGERVPKTEQIYRLAEALKTTPEYLLGLEEIKQTPTTQIEFVFVALTKNHTQDELVKLIDYLKTYVGK